MLILFVAYRIKPSKNQKLNIEFQLHIPNHLENDQSHFLPLMRRLQYRKKNQNCYSMRTFLYADKLVPTDFRQTDVKTV